MSSFASSCPCCPVTEPPKDCVAEIVPGFTEDEQTWCDDKHLSLDQPRVIKHLDLDMKNDPEYVSRLATNYGCCSSFRVLSDDGIKMMDHAVQSIEKHAVCSPRIPKVLRGGAFRSKFLNGMGHSPAVLRQVSQLTGCEMVYHPMKIQQLHINFKPNDDPNEVAGSKKNVDRWHCDTTPFVLIVFATDPDEYTGGELQYFQGTREEGVALLSSGAGLPADRVLNVGRQERGYGVLMQGWRVFHQVTAVLTGDERTTLVYSFQPRNVLALEACTHLSQTYNKVDPLHIFMPDWARYRAWKVVRRYELCAEHLPVDVTLLHGAALLDGADTAQVTELSAAVSASCTLLAHIVDTLAYTDDREVLTGLLRGAIAPVKTLLQDGSVQASAAFHESPFGLANLRGGVEDIDNAIEDILTLKDSDMEYY